MQDLYWFLAGKIGFRLSGFRRRSLPEALQTLRELGYDGVELCLEHSDLDPDAPGRCDFPTLRRILEESGLQAAAVSFHGKRAGWQEKQRKGLAGLELARDLGVRTFISGSLAGEGEEAFAAMCRFTTRMCRYAEEFGVDFAVEPEPGTVIAGTREMEMLIQVVGSPRLKVNLDVGHAHITEPDLGRDIVRWGERIVHTHIEDIRGREHRHRIPGEGDLDFAALLAAFQAIHYSGFFTLDLFDIEDQPEYYARIAREALIGRIER
ncbi:MAG: sugar phosphate isomerase/epimerase [Candidatus Zixiibacteriota bacterium]|nr:MAG: sugar phosphate isomerase/epimerase [candidate division Zixibacteria bacterium]